MRPWPAWAGTRRRYTQPTDQPTLDERIAARGHMVDFRLGRTGLAGIELQDALRDVPREVFLDQDEWAVAYEDRPLEDPDGRPVTAPSRLSLQVKAAGIKPGSRVLELSRESGYRSAILASLGADVRRVEEEPAAAFLLEERMEEVGVEVAVERGALSSGWQASAPYDVIIADEVAGCDPDSLADQLAEGGRLLVVQGVNLTRYTVQDGRLRKQGFLPLGNTLPAHDRPWVPDVGIPTMDVLEHTPGF